MQFMKFLFLLQKSGLSYAFYAICFSSPITWTIICNFYNFFPFSKNVDYHMQFLEFLSLFQKRGLSYAIYEKKILFFKNVDYHMQFLEFLSLPQKRGLLYAISEISFSSPKTWTNICNL